MNTSHNRRKSITSALIAAVAAPALLVIGAGTAQASVTTDYVKTATPNAADVVKPVQPPPCHKNCWTDVNGKVHCICL
jgi:hypothetical protein